MPVIESEFGLDNLETPVLICDPNGIVIYKNKLALETIRLPRRNTGVRSHLEQSGKTAFAAMLPDSKPQTIAVFTGDRSAKALVFPYRYRENDCTLWAFISFLQVRPNSIIFSRMEEDIIRITGDLASLFTLLAEQSAIPSGRRARSGDRRLSSKIEHIIDRVLDTRNERANWSVIDSLDILSNSVLPVFRHYGCEIVYQDKVPIKDRYKYLNFRDFVLFYSYALAFCTQISRGHRITVDALTIDESTIRFDIRFTILFSPIYGEKQTDFEKLIPLFPKNSVDLLIFSKLVQFRGYRIEYSVSEAHHNNAQIIFDLPLTKSRGLAAPKNDEFENRLLANDCRRMLEGILMVKKILQIDQFLPDLSLPREDSDNSESPNI